MLVILVPSSQKVGTWGMLPVMLLAGTSGIFYPVQRLWDWVVEAARDASLQWVK
ncbi:hypothetical protein [Nocardioides humi]|uniref:Uncharacterized protein n=1 Tax=Nocardioides humi TaxID=449461 RepID=A0ABN2BP74_9ACTN|nr:hypothetical protein [Nocardioides humi]